MAEKIPLNLTYALVTPNGKATLAFQAFLRAIGTRINSVSELAGTADDLADGITRRIREIANEEIVRNNDGTVDTITYKEKDTDAVLLTEQVNYNNDGTIASVVGTDDAGVVTTEAYTYTGDLLIAVEVGVSF